MATTTQPESVRPAAAPPAPDAPRTAARPTTVVAAARAGGRPPLFPNARPVTTAPPPAAAPVTGPAATTLAAADRAGADSAGADRSAPRAGRLTLPPVLRIVCWQLALVLGFGAVGRSWPAASGLGVAAAALLAATAVRVRGRWLSTLLARRVRLLLRRRAHELPADGGPIALLALLLPGARIGTAEIGGEQAGIVSRPDELVAVLRPVQGDPDELVRAALAGALPPDGDSDAPRLRLHLVLHRGPRQARPRAWLAVRVLRDVDAAEDTVLRVALGNAVRRLRRRLRRTGLDLTALPERELLATLTSLTHSGPGREAVREDWRYWQAGPIIQIGMRLSTLGSPPPERAPVLERLLADVPDVAVTVAVPTEGTELTGVLRVAAATPGAAEAAADQLTSLGPDLGVYLERLDGLHGPAVTASLPIGGKLR
jgi:type VII secretion protein EccE